MVMNIMLASLHNANLIFEAFQILFPTASLYLQLRGCFSKWYEKERKIKLQPLRIHKSGCFELYLLHVNSCEMFTFCDVKQYRKPRLTNSRECAVRTGNHLLVDGAEKRWRMSLIPAGKPGNISKMAEFLKTWKRRGILPQIRPDKLQTFTNDRPVRVLRHIS